MEFSKSKFEKEFKKAVTNFDERLLWFTYKGTDTFINFVWQNKLCKFKIYRYEHDINIWKRHFIDYINSGEFDFNAYWILYENNDIAPEDINKVYKFPLEKDFDVHSEELSDFLFNYRKKYPNCGIKTVGKPIIN